MPSISASAVGVMRRRPGGSAVRVEGGVEPAPVPRPGQRLERPGHAVAPEEQAGRARQRRRLDDLAAREDDLGARGHVAAGLDDAVVAERDPDAGVRADEAALPDPDDLLAAARQGAHDRCAAADVGPLADDDAGGDPPLPY